MKLNDLKEASFGSAMMTQLGKKLNPFDKSGESQMSIKDRMRQQQFVQDLVGRASVNLAQGIQSGLIDPNPNAGAATSAAPNGSGSAPTSQAPAPSTPAQNTQRPAVNPQVAAAASQKRIASQKAAAANVQKQMAANPAPAKPAPTPAPMSPAQQAAQKRQQSQAAAIANLNEAGQYAYTISSYLENLMSKYLKGADTSSLKPMINAVQASYSQDKGKAALQKLASAAYSLYWTGGAGAGQQAGAPTSIGAALSQGIKQGLGMDTGAPATSGTPSTQAGIASTPGASSAAGAAQPGTADAVAPETKPEAKPEEVKSVYFQVKDLIKTLNKQQKGWILNQLEKQLGTSPAKPAPSTAGSSAMDNMASQLASRPTTSSTGGTTTGVSGVGNGVVRHTAGKGTKIKQAAKSNAASAAPVSVPKVKKASPFPVAESKKYKVWGEK